MEEELENNPRGGNGGEALQRPEEEELGGQKHWQRWQQQQLNE
jgi:hypothetical protein